MAFIILVALIDHVQIKFLKFIRIISGRLITAFKYSELLFGGIEISFFKSTPRVSSWLSFSVIIILIYSLKEPPLPSTPVVEEVANVNEKAL